MNVQELATAHIEKIAAKAVERGLENLALVGMGCQASVPGVMWPRKVGKVSRPIKLIVGLLCSKTFDDSIFEELFRAKYGLERQNIVKMNIKGVFQLWMRNGDYHEINLKECHAWTREGCKLCPDFAAEHADISTGGIGKDNDWTLTIVRTDLGREIISRMIDDGSIVYALKVNVDGVGDRTTLSLRPERVVISPGEGSHPNVFEARVEELIYLGDHIRTRVNVCGNDEFIVKIPNSHAQAGVARGETVRIGWSTDDCRALDAA